MAWAHALIHRKAEGSRVKLCRVALVTGAVLCVAAAGYAQAKSNTPVLLTEPPPVTASKPSPETIELVVPKGTPLRVSLVKKVRIWKLGDPVTARVLEPVYSFDRVAVPAGSKVTGKVVQILPVRKLVRTEAILNGDFTPLKTAKVEFNTLILKNGTHIPIDTKVMPGIRNVIRLVARQDGKKPGLVDQAKQAIDQRWRNAIHEVKAPGKLHRLEQLGLSELPYHRQYLHAGTVYDAVLIRPLDFGKATLAPRETADLGHVPPQNTIVQARLLTSLSSATAVKGTPVKALVTKPLFSSKHKMRLLVPEGTELEGDVVQARSARSLDRNGQLRFVIRKMEFPSGPWQRVDASVEGLEVGRGARLALDSEGGARVTKSKKRYLTTALSLAIAATTVAGDSDHHMGSVKQAAGGDASTNGLAGGSGFRLVGLVVGVGLRSRVFASALGFYGAARSVYYHFLARGHNVVLARDTPMEIAFGPRLGPPVK